MNAAHRGGGQGRQECCRLLLPLFGQVSLVFLLGRGVSILVTHPLTREVQLRQTEVAGRNWTAR